MKFIRYSQDKPEYRGVLDGNSITMISGSLFHEYCLTNEKTNLNDVTVLPPLLPKKIIGLRKNYEENKKLPMLFLKPQTSVIAHKDDICLPKNIKVMAEGELGVVIGKKCRNEKEEHALSYVFGYTIANDLTGISADFADNSTPKLFDTFTPIGPVIDTTCGWENLMIKSYLNGELKQSGSTSSMFFKLPYIIAYISSLMTLEAGDIILTGTPSPSFEIRNGDEIKIEIESIGTLINKVVSNE